jgi:hypothetical protein
MRGATVSRMNSTSSLPSGRPNVHEVNDWSLFARRLSGAVLAVLSCIALMSLGFWASSKLRHDEGSGVLIAIAAACVRAVLFACAVTFIVNYFARSKHSAGWALRMWSCWFVFGIALGSEAYPWWLSTMTWMAWIIFLLHARRQWGMNWMAEERSNQEPARA